MRKAEIRGWRVGWMIESEKIDKINHWSTITSSSHPIFRRLMPPFYDSPLSNETDKLRPIITAWSHYLGLSPGFPLTHGWLWTHTHTIPIDCCLMSHLRRYAQDKLGLNDFLFGGLLQSVQNPEAEYNCGSHQENLNKKCIQKNTSSISTAVISQDPCQSNRLLKRKGLSEVVTVTHHSLLLHRQPGAIKPQVCFTSHDA